MSEFEKRGQPETSADALFVELTAGPPADPTPTRARPAPEVVLGLDVRLRTNGAAPTELARRVAAILRSQGLDVEGVDPR